MSQLAAVAVISELVVPDPRRAPVPTGWAVQIAAPSILAMDAWDSLDEAEARLRAMASYVESFGGDNVEFEKALRIVEKRRGDLLGTDAVQGRHLDLSSPRVEESDGTKNRWRTIARNWDELWPILLAATTVREVTQAELLRRANGTVHYSSESAEWSTPQSLFDVLNAEFDFDLDVCATADNAKCERYFTVSENGLERKWSGTCWMNPPYGREIGDWLKKAFESGTTVVCLVPARTDTDWWWNYARKGEIRLLRGRLRFSDADSGAPFPSALVIFGREPCVKHWESWPTG